MTIEKSGRMERGRETMKNKTREKVITWIINAAAAVGWIAVAALMTMAVRACNDNSPRHKEEVEISKAFRDSIDQRLALQDEILAVLLNNVKVRDTTAVWSPLDSGVHYGTGRSPQLSHKTYTHDDHVGIWRPSDTLPKDTILPMQSILPQPKRYNITWIDSVPIVDTFDYETWVVTNTDSNALEVGVKTSYHYDTTGWRYTTVELEEMKQ